MSRTSPAKKAARTRKRRRAANKAVGTKGMSEAYCKKELERRWKGEGFLSTGIPDVTFLKSNKNFCWIEIKPYKVMQKSYANWRSASIKSRILNNEQKKMIVSLVNKGLDVYVIYYDADHRKSQPYTIREDKEPNPRKITKKVIRQKNWYDPYFYFEN